MLALTAATRIYFYRAFCDMRKSFDGLCGLIRSELGEDPLSGSLFVFLKSNLESVYFSPIRLKMTKIKAR